MWEKTLKIFKSLIKGIIIEKIFNSKFINVTKVRINTILETVENLRVFKNYEIFQKIELFE